MGLTKWSDILNKPKAIEEVDELTLKVSELSASVLSIAGDVGELELSVSDLSASVLSISEDVGEIALDVSQLSATVLSIAGDIEEIQDKLTVEDKTINLNSTLFNVEDTENVFKCEKYGNLVILTLTNLKLLAEIVDTNHPLLISGLPVPRSAANYILFGKVITSGVQDGFRVRLSTDGELNYWYNNANLPTTKSINGQIMYLTN